MLSSYIISFIKHSGGQSPLVWTLFRSDSSVALRPTSRVKRLTTWCCAVHCVSVVNPSTNCVCPTKKCVKLPFPPPVNDIIEDRAFAIRVGLFENMVKEEANKLATSTYQYQETVKTNDPNYMFGECNDDTFRR